MYSDKKGQLLRLISSTPEEGLIKTTPVYRTLLRKRQSETLTTIVERIGRGNLVTLMREGRLLVLDDFR